MKCAILITPGVAVMDMAPAHALLSMIPRSEVYLVWKRIEQVTGFPGEFPILPTKTFENCPDHLDVLFVPAVGPEIHEDEEVIRFVKDRGEKAAWVASVCAGAILLGVAGLLDGYETATHWANEDLLTELGATVSEKRVVVDRNRITSDGGSASIEHALVMARHLLGDDFAKDMELLMEWDPQPEFCFGVGSPRKAGKERTERMLKSIQGFSDSVSKSARKGRAFVDAL